MRKRRVSAASPLEQAHLPQPTVAPGKKPRTSDLSGTPGAPVQRQAALGSMATAGVAMAGARAKAVAKAGARAKTGAKAGARAGAVATEWGRAALLGKVPDEQQARATPEPGAEQSPAQAQTSRLGFERENTAETTWIVASGDTFSRMAIDSYGHGELFYQRHIARANGYEIADDGVTMKDGRVAYLQLGESITIPPIQTLGTQSLAPNFQFDAEAPGTVPEGQFTFDHEVITSDLNRTLAAHVPSDTSGVTIGAGYDLSQRSTEQAQTELVAAGVSETTAQAYAAMAQSTLVGALARAQLANLPALNTGSELSGLEIQSRLFNTEYQRQFEVFADTLSRWELDAQGHLPAALEQIDTEIMEILMDMQYRGDMTHENWTAMRASVLANNRAAFGLVLQGFANAAKDANLEEGVIARMQDRAARFQ